MTVTGGVPSVANTTLIQIFGRAGNDQLSLDEAFGALPKAHLFGEAGDDTLVVNATAGDDTMALGQSSGSVRVTGLSATVAISGSEAANDRITINGLAGAGLVDAGFLPAGLIGFAADGGANDDVLIGGGGDDTMFGGLGDDLLLGGPGLDVLDGGPGDNIVIAD